MLIVKVGIINDGTEISHLGKPRAVAFGRQYIGEVVEESRDPQPSCPTRS
jgi:hypothetical protein